MESVFSIAEASVTTLGKTGYRASYRRLVLSWQKSGGAGQQAGRV